MKRIIILSNYEHNDTTFEIEDFEHVVCVILYVLSGDECVSVIYDDREEVWFDSCNNRTLSFFDYSSVLYIRNEFDNMDAWII